MSHIFAESGARRAIPNAMPLDASISMASGWGPIYGRDKFVDREDMNEILNIITAISRNWQLESYPEWIAPSDNSGTAVGYAQGQVVMFRHLATGPLYPYISTVNNNTTAPATTLGAINPGWQTFGPGFANIIPRAGGTTTGVMNFNGGLTTSTPLQGDNSVRIPNTSWVKQGASVGWNGLEFPAFKAWYRFGTNFGGLQLCCGYEQFPNGSVGVKRTITLPMASPTRGVGVLLNQYAEILQPISNPLVFSGNFIDNNTIAIQCHNSIFDTGVSGGVFWMAWSI